MVAWLSLALSACSSGEVPDFDAENAFRLLEEQCDIGPRYPGSKEHRTLQKYLVSRLEEFGANVSVQPFKGALSTGDTLSLVNIIGNYNLSSKNRILLGAHYDTRPYADRDPEPANRDKPILGANDGASGVAVLLEIARQLGDSKPPVGVDIVLFDGEDYGREGNARDYILGSSYFAAHMKGYTPGSVIIIDMIGDSDLKIKREGFSLAASSALLEEVYSIAEELGINAFSDEKVPSIIDDHLPFIRRGIPSIDLIDFDYPYWHTLEDTPDKCSSESLEAVGTVLLEFIWRQ
jgi:Zn-dependent M28 family amino/carboxypeptidase